MDIGYSNKNDITHTGTMPVVEKQPLVSIVTPSYNKGPFIEETIMSIQTQIYRHIEHIVMDGGSDDETLSILKKYEGRIFWKSEPDSGQSDAINKGWKMAKGEIISYLNADDTYFPDTVLRVVQYFKSHPDISIVYGDGVLSKETGEVIGTYHAGPYHFSELLYGRNFILQPTVFFRRELLDEVGYIDPTLHLVMDLDYWIRAGAKYQFGYIEKPLAGAKIYADAKSIALLHKNADELATIAKKFYSSSAVNRDVIPSENEVLNYIYCKGGLDCMHLKKPVCGIKYLSKAFVLGPFRCVRNCMDLIIATVKKITIEQ
jgi:glycosyltransferase involved in cell wall biosynthesis